MLSAGERIVPEQVFARIASMLLLLRLKEPEGLAGASSPLPIVGTDLYHF